MTRWNMKPARMAYTAELDGRYTLTDKFGEFIVSYGALTVYDFWIQITHNGEVIWKSDILANEGETAKFDGVTLDMVKGDVLAIEFTYSKKAGATATYDETRIDVDYAPVLAYEAIEPEKPYKVSDSFNGLFDNYDMAEDDEALTGAIAQPDTGWNFESGYDVGSLSDIDNFYYDKYDVL